MSQVVFVTGGGNKPGATATMAYWLGGLARQHEDVNSGLSLSLKNQGCSVSVVCWSDLIYSEQLVDLDDYVLWEHRDSLGSVTLPESIDATPLAEKDFVAALSAELGARSLDRWPAIAEFVADCRRYVFDKEVQPKRGQRCNFRSELLGRIKNAVAAFDPAIKERVIVAHGVGALAVIDALRRGAIEAANVGALLTMGFPINSAVLRAYLKESGKPVEPVVALRWLHFFRDSGLWTEPSREKAPELATVLGTTPLLCAAEPTGATAWPEGVQHYLWSPALRSALSNLLPAPAADVLVAAGLLPPEDSIAVEQSGTRLAQMVESLRQLKTQNLAVADAPKILALAWRLRNLRMFDLLAILSELKCLVDAVPRNPMLTIFWAQALIELGRYEDAETILTPAAADNAGHKKSRTEARGLLGRIAKQRYLADPDQQSLVKAVQCYQLASATDPEDAWPMVNLLALSEHGRRQPIELNANVDKTDLANKVLVMLEARAKKSALAEWDLASLGEAYLALANFPLSELWYRRYLDHPVHATSQFSLNSAVRQLRMVWQISATQPRTGAVLSPLEKALATYGRTVHIEAGIPESAAEEHLEKVFGDARMMNRLSIQRAIACCRAVGQVRKKGASTGFGTGFAIPGRSLSEKLADDWVFVTNRHVISGNKDNALRPDAASVVFHGGPGEGQPYATEFAQILYEPQNGELDVCVLKFAKFDPAFAETLTAYKIAAAMPCIDANAQAYVVGHPNGGEMMFSLQENKLLDYGLADDWRVHYRAPTQPGSSGSPVFNTDWQLIAIHHAGSKAMPRIYGEGSYEANEGVSMFAIMRLASQQLH